VQSKLDQVLNQAAVSVSDQHRGTLLREWDRLAGPGPTLNGEQRVRIASAAREAWQLGGPPADANPLVEAVGWIRCDPGGITARFWSELVERGLDRMMLTEVIALVARLCAVDSFTVGIGAGLVPLPIPFPGHPTGRLHPNAAMHACWVPTVRERVGPTGVLQAIPTEQHAVMDIHDDFYLSRQEMKSNEFDRMLTRAQIELVAARCSFLNESVYAMINHAHKLRHSRQTQPRPNLLSVTSLASVDPHVEDGSALIALADAVHAEDPLLLEAARRNLLHLGDDAVREAVAVAANFQMMSRILTATGLDASDLFPRIREQLGYAPDHGELREEDPESIATHTHPAARRSSTG